MMKEIGSVDFDDVVLNDSMPNVVKIYTDRCPNCKTLEPILEQLSNSRGDKYNFYKLNAQNHIEIAKRYKVLGVPTMLFFRHGKLVDKKTGVIGEQKIEKRLEATVSYDEEQAASKEVTGFFKLPWR